MVVLTRPRSPATRELLLTLSVLLRPRAVTPEFEPPFTPMFINIVVGVRRGDEALRDLINTGIALRWDEIAAVLKEFNVPTMPLPRPMLTLGGQ